MRFSRPWDAYSTDGYFQYQDLLAALHKFLTYDAERRREKTGRASNFRSRNWMRRKVMPGGETACLINWELFIGAGGTRIGA